MSCIGDLMGDHSTVKLEVLEKEPLAFSTDCNLISATSRMAFVTSDKSAVLNVECFFFHNDIDDDDDDDDDDDNNNNNNNNKNNSKPRKSNSNAQTPLVLYVHGVCSSAETIGVQHIVSQARKKKFRVAVLELEGHGLSSGARGVCRDFNRLVNHVIEYVKHVLTTISNNPKHYGGIIAAATNGTITTTKGSLNKKSNSNSSSGINNMNLKYDSTPFVMCGSSLGGALVAYAADYLSKNLDKIPGRFMGVALIAPAVGVDQTALPSPITISALRLLSRVIPSVSMTLTPKEDPESYAAPKNSKRNYNGHWPLATSRMLLDVTSETIKNDIKNGILTMNKVNSLIVFSGDKDDIVPFAAVKEFFENIKAREKALINVPGADHGLLYQPESASEIVNQIFQWIDLRMWAAGRANNI